MLEDFQDAVIAYPMITTLDRLLPDGVESLPDDLGDALRDDDLEAALDHCESWWNDAGPDDESAGIAYGLLLTAFEKDDRALDILRDARDAILGPTPALVLTTAEVHLNLADEETARELVERARQQLDEYPDRARPPLWAATGEFFGDLGDDDASLDCYRRAIDSGWEDFETAIRIGEMLKRDEAWGEAARAYQLAADLREDAIGPREAAAECWREAGELERALEVERPIADELAGDPDEWARRGVAWRSVGRLERAADALDRATSMDPHDPALWLELANTRLDLGEAEAALGAYEEVLSYESTLFEALEGATAAARQLGDYAAAEEYAARAVETDEATPEAWFQLGATRRELGKLDEANTALGRAADLAPDNPEVHAMLADVLLELDDTDAGRDALETAVELAPDDPNVQTQCAMALLKARQPQRLRNFIAQTSATNPLWRLVAPAFEMVADAMDDDGRATTIARDFADTARDLRDHLPVEYDTSELRRYTLVLDDPHNSLLEQIIRILEDRDDPDSLDQLDALDA